MTNIEELMKCPECLCEGHFEIVLYKKKATARCENCGFTVSDRIPYPKHRHDQNGCFYSFNIGSVRPRWTLGDDELTCSQEEWDERHK
jgi:hypothetical protein